jgi:hypothetical protein
MTLASEGVEALLELYDDFDHWFASRDMPEKHS